MHLARLYDIESLIAAREYVVFPGHNSLIKDQRMENQHRKIKGYRELDESEIDLMNVIKSHGIELGKLIDRLDSVSTLDKRWVEIGAADLQKGLMALTRAVAKPEFF